jgi:hypothetical protein
MLEMKWSAIQTRITEDLTASIWKEKQKVSLVTNMHQLPVQDSSKMQMAKASSLPMFEATTCTWATKWQTCVQESVYIQVDTEDGLSFAGPVNFEKLKPVFILWC